MNLEASLIGIISAGTKYLREEVSNLGKKLEKLSMEAYSIRECLSNNILRENELPMNIIDEEDAKELFKKYGISSEAFTGSYQVILPNKNLDAIIFKGTNYITLFINPLILKRIVPEDLEDDKEYLITFIKTVLANIVGTLARKNIVKVPTNLAAFNKCDIEKNPPRYSILDYITYIKDLLNKTVDNDIYSVLARNVPLAFLKMSKESYQFLLKFSEDLPEYLEIISNFDFERILEEEIPEFIYFRPIIDFGREEPEIKVIRRRKIRG